MEMTMTYMIKDCAEISADGRVMYVAKDEAAIAAYSAGLNQADDEADIAACYTAQARNWNEIRCKI
jgi:hypothetical protein